MIVLLNRTSVFAYQARDLSGKACEMPCRGYWRVASRLCADSSTLLLCTGYKVPVIVQYQIARHRSLGIRMVAGDRSAFVGPKEPVTPRLQVPPGMLHLPVRATVVAGVVGIRICT